MNNLLTDTLRFLEENFDTNATWTIHPSQFHLKKEEKQIEGPLPVVAFKPLTPPPQKAFTLLPSAQKNKQLPDPPPLPEKELTKNAPLGINSLSQAIKELFPHFTTHRDPPQDKDLKIDSIYKKALLAEVVLFSFREGKESDQFLQNISIAISAHFAPSAVFDAKKWELSQGNFDLFFKQAQAKLFITSQTLYKKNTLLPFLKEIPSSSERFLGNEKLLLLHPFETYFNDPLQKKELWKILCATLKKHLPLPASS